MTIPLFMRLEEPFRAKLRTGNRPILSTGTKLELLGALLIINLVIYLGPALKSLILAWALAVHTSALGSCRMPSEFEQLHIIVANRADQFVLVDCMHVGAKGAYTR